MDKSLTGRVCIVTGATRGIGKGVALQLGEHGAKVYITGRTLDSEKGSKVKGSLRETADEVNARGGICVPVLCDHEDDSEVAALFDQVSRENDGQLDILVNNAFNGNRIVIENMGKPFWEKPKAAWDKVNKVGLRNHYLCAVYGAKLMVPRKTGLIVNISSIGGLRYCFDAAYGVGKAGCDRMAADCGIELKQHNVAFVSLWPGPVSSDSSVGLVSDNLDNPAVLKTFSLEGIGREEALKRMSSVESIELTGKCIVALANDKHLMQMSGKTLLTYDLWKTYGISEEEGQRPVDLRQANVALRQAGFSNVAWLVPDFVRVPLWLMYFAGYKF